MVQFRLFIQSADKQNRNGQVINVIKLSPGQNIILVGMPASGKSTLGVVLAKTLGMDFVDTDLLIQKKTGQKLQFLIDTEGIDAFLATEEAVLCETECKNCVIATGGSAVYSDRGMRHLKQNGVVIYLHVPLFLIKKRMKNIKTRGIVMKKGTGLADLYAERKPLYEKYADLVIYEKTVGRHTPEDDIAAILQALR